MIRNLLTLGAALALCACAESADNGGNESFSSRDDALATISQQGIYAHLEYLASDALEGRMTGEPGYEMAAEYVAEQFAAMGLTPGGTDEWYQQVPLQSYRVVDDSMALTVHRESGDTQLTWVDDFIMGGDKVRPKTRLSGELVYVGFGMHAPQFGYTDFDGVDVSGKIAVALYGGPPSIPSEELAHLSSSTIKAQEMVDRGAVGTLVLYPRSMLERFPYDQLTQAYLDQCVDRVHNGEAPVADLALLKVQSTRTMEFCAREASQIIGGASYMRGERVERIYREVRVNAIGGGSEEIMLDLAARQLGI